MVTEKQIDEAMKVLLEWHENEPDRVGMPPDVFKSKVKDAEKVVDALLAAGLVKRVRDTIVPEQGKLTVFYCLAVTDKGKLYFIEQQKQQRISRRQFFQSAAIAVISAVVSTLLTLFVSQRSDGSETSSS